MKSFASPSFFRLFDMLVSATNPGLKHARWSFDGIDCEHERHSFTGRAHGFAVETSVLSRPGRRGWSLLIVKEFWWVGQSAPAARMTRWARPTGGRRGDIIVWLRTQELALARKPAAFEHALPVAKSSVPAPSRDGDFDFPVNTRHEAPGN